MNRYDLSNLENKDKNGKRYLRTVYFPEIVPSDTDIVLITRDYERMDILANKYYNNPTYWWILAHANHIKGTILVPPDTQLRVPTDINLILSNYKDLNS